MTIIRNIILFTVLFLSLDSSAWNAAGHKLSGLVAYENLSTATRDKILKVITSHPRFKKDFKMPIKIKLSDAETQNRWIFMQMAIWPDLARRFSGQERKDFHRSRWHWINEPVYLTGHDVKYYNDTLPSNLSRTYTSGNPYYFNVAQSYKMMVDSIQADNIAISTEAKFLCWIFHQVGDIHQPLHSSALFNTDKFLYGDKGGNSVYLRNINRNLHSYWDGILGESDWSYKKLLRRFKKLSSEKVLVAESRKGMNDISIDTWIRESNKLSKGIVYTPVVMEAIRKSKSNGKSVSIKLDYEYFEKYDKNSKQVAERRILEAGLRLAKLLEQLYA